MRKSATRTIRILVIDDQPVVRAGLRMLIESWPGLKVVGEAEKQGDAKTLTARHKPDIVLLDLDPDRKGKELDLLPELLSVAGDARVIILSGLRDSETHHRAVSLGAVGLVLGEGGQ